MSMAAALSNVGGGGNNMLFSIHRQRQRARLQSERVANHEIVDERAAAVAADHGNRNIPSEEEGAFINARTTSTEANNNNTNTVDIEGGSNNEQGRELSAAEQHEDGTTESDEDEEDGHDSVTADDHDDDGISRFTMRHTMTLAELEEERELARRRSSACVLFALFVLFRLWILALQDGDFGLLLLCLVGTSWTARWIRYNRDQEEELDRRIANYLEHPESSGTTTNEVGRDDLRMLSFQAQLALAIMESQRQMMQGGYGHPDGVVQTPGVSDEAKSKWTMFSYKAARDKKESRRGSYGSVPLRDPSVVNKPGYEEEPHCSICLGEYEEGEQLAKLPCAHIYHDECINSWCSNHIRCPLCNYDLESGAAESV